jgi:excisionase family DNA binding protein
MTYWRVLILGRGTVRSPVKVVELKWYTIAQVAQMLGYGLTKTKHLVLSGQIRSVKDGGNRRILPEWVDDYVRRTVKEDAG